MTLKETIEARSSIRNFSEEPVSLDDLKEIVRRATLSPSVNNQQPWHFVVITNKVLISDMAQKVHAAIEALPIREGSQGEIIKNNIIRNSSFFRNAPAIIAVALQQQLTTIERGTTLPADDIEIIRHNPNMQSVGACIQTILLSATDMGYGACWASTPLIAHRELHTLLAVPSDWQLVSFVVIGHQSEPSAPLTKKSLDEMMTIVS